MAELSSSSTLDQIVDSYVDNASYAEDDSITKARRFVSAVRILLVKRPSSMTKGSNQLNFNLEILGRQLDEAQKWLEARDPDANAGPMVTRPSFQNFRPY